MGLCASAFVSPLPPSPPASKLLADVSAGVAAVTSARGIAGIAAALVASAHSLSRAALTVLYVQDSSGSFVAVAAAGACAPLFKGARLPAGVGISEVMLRNRATISVEDMRVAPFARGSDIEPLFAALSETFPIASLIAVPLKLGEFVIAFLICDNRLEASPFAIGDASGALSVELQPRPSHGAPRAWRFSREDVNILETLATTAVCSLSVSLEAVLETRARRKSILTFSRIFLDFDASTSASSSISMRGPLDAARNAMDALSAAAIAASGCSHATVLFLEDGRIPGRPRELWRFLSDAGGGNGASGSVCTATTGSSATSDAVETQPDDTELRTKRVSRSYIRIVRRRLIEGQKGLLQACVSSRKPLSVVDALQDPRFDADVDGILCAPDKSDGDTRLSDAVASSTKNRSRDASRGSGGGGGGGGGGGEDAAGGALRSLLLIPLLDVHSNTICFAVLVLAGKLLCPSALARFASAVPHLPPSSPLKKRLLSLSNSSHLVQAAKYRDIIPFDNSAVKEALLFSGQLVRDLLPLVIPITLAKNLLDAGRTSSSYLSDRGDVRVSGGGGGGVNSRRDVSRNTVTDAEGVGVEGVDWETQATAFLKAIVVPKSVPFFEGIGTPLGGSVQADLMSMTVTTGLSEPVLVSAAAIAEVDAAAAEAAAAAAAAAAATAAAHDHPTPPDRAFVLSQWSWSALDEEAHSMHLLDRTALSLLDGAGVEGVPSFELGSGSGVGRLARCGIPTSKAQALVQLLRKGYGPRPFHCWAHAVNVAQGAALVMNVPSARCILTPVLQLLLTLSALGHDLGHTGHTNAFEWAANTPLALLHGEDGPLEKHHLATLSSILFQPPRTRPAAPSPSLGGEGEPVNVEEESSGGAPSRDISSDIFSGFTPIAIASARRAIASTLLATDMSRHMNLMEACVIREARVRRSLAVSASSTSSRATYATSSSPPTPTSSATRRLSHGRGVGGDSGFTDVEESEEDAEEALRVSLPPPYDAGVPLDVREFMEVTIHACDFVGTARGLDDVRAWARRLDSEFSAQAAEEAALGLPVTPYMVGLTSSTQASARLQVAFVSGIVLPLWTSLHNILGGARGEGEDALQEPVAGILRGIAYHEEERERVH